MCGCKKKPDHLDRVYMEMLGEPDPEIPVQTDDFRECVQIIVNKLKHINFTLAEIPMKNTSRWLSFSVSRIDHMLVYAAGMHFYWQNRPGNALRAFMLVLHMLPRSADTGVKGCNHLRQVCHKIHLCMVKLVESKSPDPSHPVVDLPLTLFPPIVQALNAIVFPPTWNVDELCSLITWLEMHYYKIITTVGPDVFNI